MFYYRTDYCYVLQVTLNVSFIFQPLITFCTVQCFESLLADKLWKPYKLYRLLILHTVETRPQNLCESYPPANFYNGVWQQRDLLHDRKPLLQLKTLQWHRLSGF